MIFKVTAQKNGRIAAEYIYENEDTATIFAHRMKEQGYQIIVEKVPTEDGIQSPMPEFLID